MKARRLHIQVSEGVCNNSCIFCCDQTNERGLSLTGSSKDVEAQMKEALHEYRIRAVMFTSGEPTINPNLLSWIGMAKNMGFSEISLITNGRMFAYESFAKAVFEKGINLIIVSVHGHTAKLHNAHTRDPASFYQTCEGLKNIARLKAGSNFKLEINCTVTRLNYRHMDKFLCMALRFGPDIIHFNLAEPIGRAERFARAVIPRYSKVADEFCRAVKKHKLLNKKNSAPEIKITAQPCLLGKRFLPFVSYFEESFRALESKRIGPVEQLPKSSRTKGKECENCAHFQFCEGVPKNYVKLFGWQEFRPAPTKENQAPG